MYILDNINWMGIPKKIVIWALVYSFIFPITYLIGGAIASIGNIITFPFLPGAWIVSKGFVYLFGSGNIYLFGLAIGIFFQLGIIAWLSKKCFVLKTREKCISCVLAKMALFVFLIFCATLLFYGAMFYMYSHR
ncbi:hypothetical protein [uncultured Sulfuricurvum sp.]|uniref:hypothetical protein n=1 Tax=Sulfuricurvum sp. TaxID=2025608 RepID=UPI002631A938|nr:hypothetical protein [uncultured Sulfuricurvum sp.]